MNKKNIIFALFFAFATILPLSAVDIYNEFQNILQEGRKMLAAKGLVLDFNHVPGTPYLIDKNVDSYVPRKIPGFSFARGFFGTEKSGYFYGNIYFAPVTEEEYSGYSKLSDFVDAYNASHYLPMPAGFAATKNAVNAFSAMTARDTAVMNSLTGNNCKTYIYINSENADIFRLGLDSEYTLQDREDFLMKRIAGNVTGSESYTGSSNGTQEDPVCDFYVSKFFVTKAEFNSIVKGIQTPSYGEEGFADSITNIRVRWSDCAIYCNKLSIMMGYEPCYSINGVTDPDLWPEISENTEAWYGLKCDYNANGFRLLTQDEMSYLRNKEVVNTDIQQLNGDTPVDDGVATASDLYGLCRSNAFEWLNDFMTDVYSRTEHLEGKPSLTSVTLDHCVVRLDKWLMWNTSRYEIGKLSGLYAFRVCRSSPEEMERISACVEVELNEKQSARDAVLQSMALQNLKDVYVEGKKYKSIKISNTINKQKSINVNIPSYYMTETEISQELFETVMGFNPSAVKGEKLPVTNITLREACEFCNALSALKGLEPCYTFGSIQINPEAWAEVSNNLRTPNTGVVSCNFAANGYRLPSIFEWEYASEGGASAGRGKYDNGKNVKDTSWFCTASTSETLHETGLRTPNSLGLYDMYGNASEMVWAKSIYDFGSATISDSYYVTNTMYALGGNASDLVTSKNASFQDFLLCTSTARDFIGLRLVRTAE